MPLAVLFFGALIVASPAILLGHIIYKLCVKNRNKFSFDGKTVLITGASSGMGLEMSKECVRRGCKRLIMVARDTERLKSAREEVLCELVSADNGNNSSDDIIAVSCDVCDPAQIERRLVLPFLVRDALQLDAVILSQGTSIPKYAHSDSTDEMLQCIRKQMDINYHGSVNTIVKLLPFLVRSSNGSDGDSQQPAECHIMTVGSACSCVSFIGYGASGYSPSKYALRAYMEGLRNELVGTNVRCHFAMPPDVDTPGYRIEQLTKPWECVVISGGKRKPPTQQQQAGEQEGKAASEPEPPVLLSGNEHNARDMAKQMLNGIEANNRFYIPIGGIDQQLLCSATSGLSGAVHTCPVYHGLILGMVSLIVAPIYRLVVMDGVVKKRESREGRLRGWAQRREQELERLKGQSSSAAVSPTVATVAPSSPQSI